MPIASPKHANDPLLQSLGTAIRRIREEQGITQEDLAHQTHIDRGYMSSIERGKQNPGIMSIFRIANALGLTLAELMEEAKL